MRIFLLGICTCFFYTIAQRIYWGGGGGGVLKNRFALLFGYIKSSPIFSFTYIRSLLIFIPPPLFPPLSLLWYRCHHIIPRAINVCHVMYQNLEEKDHFCLLFHLKKSLVKIEIEIIKRHFQSSQKSLSKLFVGNKFTFRVRKTHSYRRVRKTNHIFHWKQKISFFVYLYSCECRTGLFPITKDCSR